MDQSGDNANFNQVQAQVPEPEQQVEKEGHSEVIQTEKKNTTKSMASELSSMDPFNTEITRLNPVNADTVIRYLNVFVVGVEGTPEADKKEPSYKIEVSVDGKTLETAKSKDLTWYEVFRFRLMREPVESHIETRSRDTIFFTLKDESHVFTRTVGVIAFGLEDILPESMIEITKGFQLTDKKGKVIDENESDSLKLKFRVNIESLPYENRHLAAKPLQLPSSMSVVYPENNVTFKPGDVILYNLPGPLGSLIKVKNGTAWSHCGLVVGLPNKWTGEYQLYVLEYTRNIEGFFDIYSEEFLTNGPMLFKLEERIYGAPGTEVWLMPIKNEVCYPDSASKLAAWVNTIRDKYIRNLRKLMDGKEARDYYSDLISWDTSDVRYFKEVKIDISNSFEYCEALSAHFCKVGIEKSFDVSMPGYASVYDLTLSKTSQNVFERPFLIRCRQEYKYNISWPFPVGTTGPKKVKKPEEKYEYKDLKELQEEKKLLIPKVRPCIGMVGQIEALDQIQLLNYYIFAEEQVLAILDGIIFTREDPVLSEATSLKSDFERNKEKFEELLSVIVDDYLTLSVDQLKKADSLVSEHNKCWERLEKLIIEASKTNEKINYQSLSDDETQRHGKIQMDILSYLLTYEEKALEFLEKVQSHVPQDEVKRCAQIRETFVDLYKTLSSIRDEILASNELMNEQRIRETEKLATDHKVAWIEFEKFVLNMSKYQVMA